MKFTSLNAREMGLKSVAARNKARAKARTQRLTQPDAAPGSEDAYLVQRLLTIREQIQQVDQLMLRERDPRRLASLTHSLTRLSRQERMVTGWLLPPVLGETPTQNPSAVPDVPPIGPSPGNG